MADCYLTFYPQAKNLEFELSSYGTNPESLIILNVIRISNHKYTRSNGNIVIHLEAIKYLNMNRSIIVF